MIMVKLSHFILFKVNFRFLALTLLLRYSFQEICHHVLSCFNVFEK